VTKRGRADELADEAASLVKDADAALRHGRRSGVNGRILQELEHARDEVAERGVSGPLGRRRGKKLARLMGRAEGTRHSAGREGFETIAYAVGVAIVIRIFLVQAFQIPTSSMERTLLVGDYLLVNKFLFGAKTPDRIPFTKIRLPAVRLPGLRDPRPGDIIVFAYPWDTTQDYIKRCVAAGGQTVEVKDKRLYVDDVLQEEPFVHLPRNTSIFKRGRHDPFPQSRTEMRRTWGHMMRDGPWNRDNFGPVTVPEGQLFMMGDNRDFSSDSRYWGFLDEDLIRGKAFVIYFSRDRDLPLWNMIDGIRWSRLGGMIR
jgi:signal peptidase I